MFEKLLGWEYCFDAWLKFEKVEYGYYVKECKEGAEYCEIPEIYKGKPVIGIYKDAFSMVTTLKSVTLPASIRVIEASTFEAFADSVFEVNITDLGAFCRIEFNGIWMSQGALFINGRKLRKLELPGDIDRVSSFAFAGFNNIHEVIVPGNVGVIGNSAFFGCNGLTRVEMLDGVGVILDSAFASCPALSEVVLSGTLTEIGDRAFEDCPSLSEIDIPDSVERIGEYAFSGSFDNGRVRFGSGIREIGTRAFSPERISEVSITDMDAWSELSLLDCSPVGKNTVVYSGEWEMEEFIFKAGIEKIRNGALADFGKLLSVYIPASVREIEDRAFLDSEISTIHFGGTSTDWENIKVNIDNGNEALRSAHIEYDVSLERVLSGGGEDEKLSHIEDMPYDGHGTVVLGDAEVWVKMTDDGEGWIITECENKADKPTRLILPDLLGGKPIVEIADYLFMDGITYKDMDRFTTLRLSDSVRKIGSSAFEGCSALKDVRLGTGLREIGREAFGGCSSLREINLPEGLVRIETAAFRDCTSLKSFELPSTTTDLYERVLTNCPSLSSLTVREGNPDFYSDRDCIISTYDNSLYQGCVDSVIPMDGTITTIGLNAFDTVNIKRVIIPAGVTLIAPYAFASSGIEEIIIPDTVKNIGTAAFYNCSMLNSISLPEGLSELASSLFSEAVNLTEVYIPRSVTVIESYVFNGCESLSTIRFGGTREEWGKIQIGEDNEALAGATVIFAE